MPKDSAGLGELLVAESLSRIDGKLDKLDDRLDEQGKTLAKQQVVLEEHVKRSNLLEAKIDLETKQIKETLPKEVEAQIKLQRNKFLINALKILGVIAGTGGGGMAIKEGITWALKFWGE
jgi:hypothetical protein